jgi:hypothetical protein
MSRRTCRGASTRAPGCGPRFSLSLSLSLSLCLSLRSRPASSSASKGELPLLAQAASLKVLCISGEIMRITRATRKKSSFTGRRGLRCIYFPLCLRLTMNGLVCFRRRFKGSADFGQLENQLFHFFRASEAA